MFGNGMLPMGRTIEREEIAEVYPQGDLPYLDFLLNQINDSGQVKSEIYNYHKQNGNFEAALKAESCLKAGFDYAKGVFPEIKDYLKNQLVSLGYRLESDADIKDPEIIALRLPSISVKGVESVDGRKREYQGFSGAVAAVTPIYVQRRKTDKGYIMMANLPLANLPEEQVKAIGLHELIHIYFSELGISEEEQKKLEPYIDKWMINFYEKKGQFGIAEGIREHSGYLNKAGSQKERPCYTV